MEELYLDSLEDKLKEENSELKKKYKYALRRIRMKEEEINAIIELQKTPQTTKILPSKGGSNEATACLIYSDWHVDEVVKPERINFVNEFNPEIAGQRLEYLFQNSLKLLNIAGKDVKVKNAIIALLGDFISGNIHEELMENCSLLPLDAIMYSQNVLSTGIQFLLDNTKLNFTIVCTVGNHPRITKKRHISSEVGNSLEFYMYHTLAKHFEKNKRVKFVISQGYFSYLDVYGFNIRFHHGHNIRYYGGVGGVYIPVNKAISQWNKVNKAYLDVMGHFHQYRDGGNFIINGSVIGYNSFGESIKADYETPKQVFFLIDKKKGKTIKAPIFLEKV